MNEKPHNNPNYEAPEMKYRQGDILVNFNGTNYIRILAVIGEVYLISIYEHSYDDAQETDVSSSYLYTENELDKLNWSLAEEPKPKPETVDVLGKTYKKSDVEEKLAELEEAE